MDRGVETKLLVVSHEIYTYIYYGGEGPMYYYSLHGVYYLAKVKLVVFPSSPSKGIYYRGLSQISIGRECVVTLKYLLRSMVYVKLLSMKLYTQLDYYSHYQFLILHGYIRQWVALFTWVKWFFGLWIDSRSLLIFFVLILIQLLM